MTGATTQPPLLTVRNLKTHVFTSEGVVKAVDGVDLEVARGRTLCIVGESGCGKSLTARSILRIVPAPGRIVDGEILLRRAAGDVVDLSQLDPRGSEIRKIRGRDVAMIFQEPMTSLSPVHTIGNQIVEAIRLHFRVGKAEAHELAIEALDRVGIPKPERNVNAYTFQLSGGMRQRAMIAMALSCRPELLVADEPTTALDVTTQANILELMRELQSDLGMAMIFITHDLGVVAEVADEVAVMYLGRVVERGTVDEIFYEPKHPYTRALLESVPKLGTGDRRELAVIRGRVPPPFLRPIGCSFHPRCDAFMPGTCDAAEPASGRLADGRDVRCFLYEETVRATEARNDGPLEWIPPQRQGQGSA